MNKERERDELDSCFGHCLECEQILDSERFCRGRTVVKHAELRGG